MEVKAILRVREGIRIRDLKECFRKMNSVFRVCSNLSKVAYIAVRRHEDDESNGIVETGSSSEEDDPSEFEDESDGDDSDESDAGAGAGGAGMGGSGEPNDSDDDDSSEDDDAGGSS